MAIEYTLKRWDKLSLYAGTVLLDPDGKNGDIDPLKR
jgi:hypothetical protein